MKRNRTLGKWEEVCGNLAEVSADECDIIASISGMRISLPQELLPTLQQHIGIGIGILRTDIPAKEFLIRVIQKKTDDGNDSTELDAAAKASKVTAAGSNSYLCEGEVQ